MDKLPILKIDPEFKDLIRPLRRKEYLQLEENILDEGCRDPIIIWNDYIIDGHNRYSICTKYSIPFNTVSKDFSSREEVIVWICKNQHSLQSKQDETDEDYIIDSEPEQSIQRSKNKTAHIIGAENNITHATVQKYAYFSRALDHIAEQCPELKTKILSGRYKISHKNVLALEQLSPKELTQLNVRLDRGNHPFVQYCTTRSIIENEPKEETKPHQPSVKDMPEHNPDAPVIQLCLTVPSWITSIQKATESATIANASDKAKQQLLEILDKLKAAIDTVTDLIKED